MMGDGPAFDPYRHLKRLNKVFGVSKRIHQLAQSHVKPEITSKELTEEAEFLVNAKLKRDKRINSIDTVHHSIIEVIASHFNVQYENLLEGIVDSDQYVDLIRECIEKHGRKAILFYYDVFNYPPKGKY